MSNLIYQKAEIIEQLDIEMHHAPFIGNNQRRATQFEEARTKRQALGLRDELAAIVFNSSTGYQHDREKVLLDSAEGAFSPEELSIADTVHKGYVIRMGWYEQIPPDYVQNS